MTIKSWAPFSAFTSLEQEFHSLLDRIGARPWMEGFGWRPDTDIYRRDGHLVVEVELPGVDPGGGLSVEVEGSVLRVTGERACPADVDEKDRYVTERRFGAFERAVMLPDGIDLSSISAACREGLLIVRIPLPGAAPAAPVTRIEVSG